MESVIMSEVHPEQHKDNPPQNLYATNIFRRLLDHTKKDLNEENDDKKEWSDYEIIKEILENEKYNGVGGKEKLFAKDIRAMYGSFNEIMGTKYEDVSEEVILNSFATCIRAVQQSITEKGKEEVGALFELAGKSGIEITAKGRDDS